MGSARADCRGRAWEKFNCLLVKVGGCGMWTYKPTTPPGLWAGGLFLGLGDALRNSGPHHQKWWWILTVQLFLGSTDGATLKFKPITLRGMHGGSFYYYYYCKKKLKLKRRAKQRERKHIGGRHKSLVIKSDTPLVFKQREEITTICGWFHWGRGKVKDLFLS